MKQFALIIKLVLAIVLIMFFGDLVPEGIQRAFYTLSISIKETLVFLMPLIVFAFIFSCLSSFQQKAPLLIVMVLLLVTASNFIFNQLGYFVGDLFFPYFNTPDTTSPAALTSDLHPLMPFFTIPFPELIRPDIALIIGTIAGLYGAFWGTEKLARWGDYLKNKVQLALTRVFIPLVPLYVIGFLFKIQHDDSLLVMLSGYGPMIGLIILTQLFAILIYFYKVNLGNIKNIKASLRNAFPSGLVGFSTMSSVASLPLTIEAAEKNTKNKSLAQMIIPATVNIHHVGDSISVPILMAAVYAINGFEPMSYGTFLIFSMYYMVAKYAVASVPGGEIIVLLPILEGQFGFNSSMSGLITTLYILIDPFGTTTNVTTNGAFAILMDKLCGRMKAFQAEELVPAKT